MGTREQWARDFLAALGNNKPDDRTLNFVAAWTAAEDTKARYNPLATTLDYGENTKFNNCCGGNGVKNYITRQQGIEASILTLKGNHRGYAELRAGLLNNDGQRAINSGGLDTWGSGSARVALIWSTRDLRNDTLKSEDTSTPPSQVNNGGIGHNPEKILPQPKPQLRPTGSLGGDYPESTEVTASGVQKAMKIALGSLIAITATILVIVSASKTDTAKIATKIATKGLV